MEERDHRRIGRELDLFTFSDLVGGGLPLWTPKGTVIRQELDAFVWALRSRYDYEKVAIPHITKKELYEKSYFGILTMPKHVLTYLLLGPREKKFGAKTPDPASYKEVYQSGDVTLYRFIP